MDYQNQAGRYQVNGDITDPAELASQFYQHLQFIDDSVDLQSSDENRRPQRLPD